MTGVELVTVGVAAIIAGAVGALAGGGTLITFPVLLAAGSSRRSLPMSPTPLPYVRDIWEERLPSSKA